MFLPNGPAEVYQEWRDMRCEGGGNWNEIKGKLKQKYGQLTDDDVTFAEGQEDELLGRLQQRLDKSKEEVCREIEEF
jgi:uncharacterized protein YjbJ (UPF0337 family)